MTIRVIREGGHLRSKSSACQTQGPTFRCFDAIQAVSLLSLARPSMNAEDMSGPSHVPVRRSVMLTRRSTASERWSLRVF